MRMAREHVLYTTEWFYDVAARFFRDICRSIAFGVIIFFSLVFLLGVPLLIYSTENVGIVDSFDTSSPNVTGTVVAFLFIGLPLCILCWWAALEVADDRHWEKPCPTIWDNQPARWIEHTVRYVRYLESQGKTTDTSLVFSDDIYAATHKLIDDTDEATVRLLLSALLANTTARISSPCRQLESYKEI
jgi:hypothetical protein